MSNLGLIERAVAFACRRYQLNADDAEEFVSIVNVKLIDDDYAVLRAWEQRSSFKTYISIVVQRVALDYRIQTWGKWRASAEAKRLGEMAEEVEKLLLRDGRTLDEVLVALAQKHPHLTHDSLRELADRFPARSPKPRLVDLEAAESFAVTHAESVEKRLFDAERKSASEKLSAVMVSEIASLSEEDRLVLQLRFEGGMTVAEIARSLRIDQKTLYRRIERCLRALRANLEESGLVSRDVLDLIGRDEAILDFELRKLPPRPSMDTDEMVATQSEDS